MQVEFELKHYGILESDSLVFYLVFQSIVLLNVAVMMLDAFIGLAQGSQSCTEIVSAGLRHRDG